ncbi:hypothetical protein cyc_01363 [Cyclospora cayetanensis]|uniref:Uncharacterized protein n=1 Tax=Cyclospora cayetanensis TaxID=88456 RepID=A0A1D3CSZ3_9EIME|nr:hypothetical protein cyc_01363 [Cyclospora cayetanensis]
MANPSCELWVWIRQPPAQARQPPVSLCGGSKAERRQVAQAVASVILLRVFDGALRTLDALGSPKFMGQLETETSQHGPHVTAVKPPQQHMGSSRDHPGETTAQQSSFSSAESISRMTGGKPTAAISHSTTATAETTSAGHPPAGTTAGTQQQHVGPLGAPKHPSHPGALQRALQTTFAERVKSFFRQQQHSRVLHFLDGGPTAFGGIAASGSVRRPGCLPLMSAVTPEEKEPFASSEGFLRRLVLQLVPQWLRIVSAHPSPHLEAPPKSPREQQPEGWQRCAHQPPQRQESSNDEDAPNLCSAAIGKNKGSHNEDGKSSTPSQLPVASALHAALQSHVKKASGSLCVVEFMSAAALTEGTLLDGGGEEAPAHAALLACLAEILPPKSKALSCRSGIRKSTDWKISSGDKSNSGVGKDSNVSSEEAVRGLAAKDVEVPPKGLESPRNHEEGQELPRATPSGLKALEEDYHLLGVSIGSLKIYNKKIRNLLALPTMWQQQNQQAHEQALLHQQQQNTDTVAASPAPRNASSDALGALYEDSVSREEETALEGCAAEACSLISEGPSFSSLPWESAYHEPRGCCQCCFAVFRCFSRKTPCNAKACCRLRSAAAALNSFAAVGVTEHDNNMQLLMHPTLGLLLPHDMASLAFPLLSCSWCRNWCSRCSGLCPDGLPLPALIRWFSLEVKVASLEEARSLLDYLSYLRGVEGSGGPLGSPGMHEGAHYVYFLRIARLLSNGAVAYNDIYYCLLAPPTALHMPLLPSAMQRERDSQEGGYPTGDTAPFCASWLDTLPSMQLPGAAGPGQTAAKTTCGGSKLGWLLRMLLELATHTIIVTGINSPDSLEDSFLSLQAAEELRCFTRKLTEQPSTHHRSVAQAVGLLVTEAFIQQRIQSKEQQDALHPEALQRLRAASAMASPLSISSLLLLTRSCSGGNPSCSRLSKSPLATPPQRNSAEPENTMEPLETPSVEQQDQNHENSCKGILEGLAAPLDAVNQLLQLSRCAAFLIAPSAAGRTAALRRLFQALKGLDLAAPPGQYSFGEKPEGSSQSRYACSKGNLCCSNDTVASRRTSCPADVFAGPSGGRKLTFQKPNFHLEVISGLGSPSIFYCIPTAVKSLRVPVGRRGSRDPPVHFEVSHQSHMFVGAEKDFCQIGVKSPGLPVILLSLHAHRHGPPRFGVLVASPFTPEAGGPRKELSVNAEQARRASARCVPQDTQQQLQPLSKEKVKALDAPGKKCAEALENACEELGESSLWGPEGWMLRCLQCWESVDLLHGEALVLLLRPHVLVIRLFEKSKEERDIAAAAARGLTRSQRRAIMYTSLMVLPWKIEPPSVCLSFFLPDHARVLILAFFISSTPTCPFVYAQPRAFLRRFPLHPQLLQDFLRQSLRSEKALAIRLARPFSHLSLFQTGHPLQREQLLQLQGLSLLCSQTADLLQSIAEATNKHRPQGQHHIAFVPTLISRHLSKECSEDVKGGELCRGPSEALVVRVTVGSPPRHLTTWSIEQTLYFSEALYRLAETLFEFHDAATAAAHDKKDTLSTQQQCYGYRHQQEKEHQTPALFEHQQQTDFHPGSPTTVVGLLLSFLESQNQTPQYLEAFMQVFTAACKGHPDTQQEQQTHTSEQQQQQQKSARGSHDRQHAMENSPIEERSPQKELSEHCSSQSADAQVPLSDIQATIAARMLQYLHAATTPLSPVSLEGLLACAEAPESVAPPQLREIPPGHLQDAAKLTPERGASDGAKSCMSSSSATPTRGSIDTQYPPEGLPKALTEHQLESSPSLRAERSGNSHSSRDADTDSDNTLASSLNEPSRGQEAFLARDEFAQAAKSVPFPKLAEEASFQKANNECRMALGDLQRPASSAKPLSIQGGCTPLDGSPFTTAPHADQTLFLPAVPQEPHVHEAGLLSPRNSSAFCSLSSSLDGDSFFEDFVEGNQEGSQAAVASEVEPLVKVTGYKETSSLLHSEAQLHDTFTLFLEQREQQQGQQHRHVGADSNQDAGVGDPEGNAVSIRAGSVALAAKPSDAFAEAGKLVRKAERKTWASTQNAELEGMHTHATAERITGQASAAAKAVRPPPTQALPRSVISAGTEKTHAGHLEPSSGAVSQGSNAAAMPAGGTSAAQALDTDAAQNVCAAPPALKLPEVFLADAPDTTERAGAKGYTTHIGTSSIRSAVHALPFEDIAIGGDPTAAEAARANSAESAVVEAKAAAAAAGCAQQAKERVVDTVAASSAMLRATTDATPAAGAAVATAAESESMKKAVVANAREAESKGAHTSSVAGVPERPAATAAAIGERVATDSTAGASASMKAYVSAKKAVEASQLLASAAAAAIAGRRQASEATADATAFADAAASKALEAVASAQKCTDAEFRCVAAAEVAEAAAERSTATAHDVASLLMLVAAAEQRLQALVTAARASEQAAACSRSAAEAASAHAADAAADAEKQDQEADAYKGAAKSAALAAQEAANIAYGIVAEIEQQAATAFATLQRAQTEAEVAYGELKAASKQEETKIKELSSAAADSEVVVQATVRVVQEAAEAASGCVSAAEKHHRACEEAARRALQAAAAANAAAAELHMHKEEAATNAARTRNHWEVAAMHCAGVEQHLLDAATDAKQVQEHAIAVTTAATTAADQLQHVKDSGNLARAAAAAAQEASDVAAGIVAGLQQKQAAATAIIEGPHDAQKQKGRGAGGHSKSPQHKEAATAAAAAMQHSRLTTSREAAELQQHGKTGAAATEEIEEWRQAETRVENREKVTSAAAFAATIAAERSPKQLSQASGEPQSAALATHAAGKAASLSPEGPRHPHATHIKQVLQQASTASDGARSEHEEWVPKCGVSKPTENASGTHLQDEAAKCAATVAQQHMQAAEGSAAAAEASALRCVEIETQLRCLADKAAAGAASDRLMLKEAFQAVVTAAARSQKHVEALCAATEEATTEAAEQIRLAVESVQEAGEFADPAKAAAEAAVTAAESASAAKAAAAIAAAQAASSQEASKTATRGAVASLKAADTAVRAERVAAEQLGMVVVATSHISQKVSLILSHREGASTATANPNAAGVSTGKLTIGASGKKPHLIPPDGAGVVVEIRSASKGVEGRQQKLNHSAKRPGAPGTSNEVVAAKSSGSRPSCWTRLPALPAEPSGSTCTAGDSAIDISQRSHTSVIKNTESRSNNNSSTRSSENNKQATRGVVIARVRQPQTTHTKGIMAPVMEPSRSTVSPAVTAASALRVESSSVLSLESSSSCSKRIYQHKRGRSEEDSSSEQQRAHPQWRNWGSPVHQRQHQRERTTPVFPKPLNLYRQPLGRQQNETPELRSSPQRGHKDSRTPSWEVTEDQRLRASLEAVLAGERRRRHEQRTNLLVQSKLQRQQAALVEASAQVSRRLDANTNEVAALKRTVKSLLRSTEAYKAPRGGQSLPHAAASKAPRARCCTACNRDSLNNSARQPQAEGTSQSQGEFAAATSPTARKHSAQRDFTDDPEELSMAMVLPLLRRALMTRPCWNSESEKSPAAQHRHGEGAAGNEEGRISLHTAERRDQQAPEVQQGASSLAHSLPVKHATPTPAVWGHKHTAAAAVTATPPQESQRDATSDSYSVPDEHDEETSAEKTNRKLTSAATAVGKRAPDAGKSWGLPLWILDSLLASITSVPISCPIAMNLFQSIIKYQLLTGKASSRGLRNFVSLFVSAAPRRKPTQKREKGQLDYAIPQPLSTPTIQS